MANLLNLELKFQTQFLQNLMELWLFYSTAAIFNLITLLND